MPQSCIVCEIVGKKVNVTVSPPPPLWGAGDIANGWQCSFNAKWGTLQRCRLGVPPEGVL